MKNPPRLGKKCLVLDIDYVGSFLFILIHTDSIRSQKLCRKANWYAYSDLVLIHRTYETFPARISGNVISMIVLKEHSKRATKSMTWLFGLPQA